MCLMQGTPNKAAVVEFSPLPMRVGVAGVGAVGARRGSRETYRVLRVNHIEFCASTTSTRKSALE